MHILAKTWIAKNCKFAAGWEDIGIQDPFAKPKQWLVVFVAPSDYQQYNAHQQTIVEAETADEAKEKVMQWLIEGGVRYPRILEVYPAR